VTGLRFALRHAQARLLPPVSTPVASLGTVGTVATVLIAGLHEACRGGCVSVAMWCVVLVQQRQA
jgi:hypothetical protein